MKLVKAGLLTALVALGARSFPSLSVANAHAPAATSTLEVSIDRQDGIHDPLDLDDRDILRASDALSALLVLDPEASKEEIARSLEDEFDTVTATYDDPIYYMVWDEEAQEWVRVCVGAETYLLDDVQDADPVRVQVRRTMIVG